MKSKMNKKKAKKYWTKLDGKNIQKENTKKFSDAWIRDHFRRGFSDNQLHRYYGISTDRLTKVKRNYYRALIKKGFSIGDISNHFDISSKKIRDLLRLKKREYRKLF